MTEHDMGIFRKTLLHILGIAFTGALLVYTGIANLNLLTTVYPDAQFVMFGMIALEGGVIYWTGYYLLHKRGMQKGIAVSMAVVDFVFSMVGFFLDINLHTGGGVKTSLPPVVILMAIDVALNVGMGLLMHFLPHGDTVGTLLPSRNVYTVDDGRTTGQLEAGASVVPLSQSRRSDQPKYDSMQFSQMAKSGSPTPLRIRMKNAFDAFRGFESQTSTEPATEEVVSQEEVEA